MNLRKLAEILAGGELWNTGEIEIRDVIDALIAQADLLEKYRKNHRPNVFYCDRWPANDDRRCDLCRAYDAMMKD